MKRLMIILAAVGLMSFAASCKKCYTCSSPSMPGSYCDDVYNAAQLDVLKGSCESYSGTWTAQ